MNARQDKLLSETWWEGMGTFPKDGTKTDILFEGGAIARGVHWGYPPIGPEMTWVGDTNILSPYLVANRKMIGWCPHEVEQ